MAVQHQRERLNALVAYLRDDRRRGVAFMEQATQRWPGVTPEEIEAAAARYETTGAGHMHFGALAWARRLRQERATMASVLRSTGGPSRRRPGAGDGR